MDQQARNLALPDDLLRFARELRETQTDAERLLCSVLRGRRFLKLKFRRQHPIEPYVLDFFCDELNWAIELDGGQHNSVDGRRHDRVRSEYLARRGIVVTRFWNHEVLGDFETVLEALFRVAVKLREKINLLPSGEGGDAVAG
jgi:very-short-patch-repair endonuclease